MPNVSRSFVIKEMDSGALPDRLVGKHRRSLNENEHVRADALRTARSTGRAGPHGVKRPRSGTGY